MEFKEKLVNFFASAKNKNYVNKYYIAIFAFVIWLSFFDRYSFVTQYKLSQNILQLENKQNNYEELLAKALIERKTINSNIEKYGREHYYFHKPDEKVILVK